MSKTLALMKHYKTGGVMTGGVTIFKGITVSMEVCKVVLL